MLVRDMFSGEYTLPRSEGCVDASIGFNDFWLAWPTGPRKVARKQCGAKWIAKGCANHAEIIRLHVEWMKTQDDWLKNGGAFICAPLVYLNQERWADWTPVEVKARPLIDPALEKIARDRAQAAPMPEYVRNLRKRINP